MLDDSLLSRYPGSIFALLDANGTESFTITRTITGVLKCSMPYAKLHSSVIFPNAAYHLTSIQIFPIKSPANVSNEGRR